MPTPDGQNDVGALLPSIGEDISNDGCAFQHIHVFATHNGDLLHACLHLAFEIMQTWKQVLFAYIYAQNNSTSFEGSYYLASFAKPRL